MVQPGTLPLHGDETYGIAYAGLVGNTAYAARIGSGNIILERAEPVRRARARPRGSAELSGGVRRLVNEARGG